MEKIVDDVLKLIILNVDYTDLLSIACVSKRFMLICSCESHFKQRLEIEYPGVKKRDDMTNLSIYKILKNYEYGRAQLIEIPESVYQVDDQNEEDVSLIILSEVFLSYIQEENLQVKRGDIVHFEFEGDYRNSGIYVYNGKDLSLLDYDNNPYGSISKEFSICDDDLSFSYKYWEDVCDYSEDVHFIYTQYIDQMIDNIKFKSEEKDCDIFETHFIHLLGVQFKVYLLANKSDSLDYVKQLLIDKVWDFYPYSDYKTPYEIYLIHQ